MCTRMARTISAEEYAHSVLSEEASRSPISERRAIHQTHLPHVKLEIEHGPAFVNLAVPQWLTPSYAEQRHAFN